MTRRRGAAFALAFACAPAGPLGCSAEPASTPTVVARDAPPVPRLAFAFQPPTSVEDYPFDAAHLPSEGPPPGAVVFLSARGSFDPEGQAIDVFWNVRDRKGNYLSLDPGPTAQRVAFTVESVGLYTVALSITERDGLRRTEQAQVTFVAGPRACAPDGVSPPCSDLASLPGGTFVMGSADGDGDANERPVHITTVAPFALDRYEATVGRFRRFLESYQGTPPREGSGAHPLLPDSGWQSSWDHTLPGTREDFVFAIGECGGSYTARPGTMDAHPVSCITWFEAFAFCISEGKRLPTEAEWEYAARGGEEQRTYPWGASAPSSEYAVFGCLFDGDPFCSADDLPVVGSRPRGAARWGHLDLAGSVWEWTLDAYAPYSELACADCASVSAAADAPRVFRGGDFRFDDPSSLRGASRYAFDGAFPDQTRGVRCAQSSGER